MSQPARRPDPRPTTPRPTRRPWSRIVLARGGQGRRPGQRRRRRRPATPTRSRSPMPGPSDADSVVLDDSVPSALTRRHRRAPTSAATARPRSATRSRAALPASLAVGATWTVTRPLQRRPGSRAQTVTNTATATSDENPGGVDGLGRDRHRRLGRPRGQRQRRAGQRGRRRRPDPRLPITVSNGGPPTPPRCSLTDSWPTRLQPGRDQPVAGHLHARSARVPTSAATWAPSPPGRVPP